MTSNPAATAALVATATSATTNTVLSTEELTASLRALCERQARELAEAEARMCGLGEQLAKSRENVREQERECERLRGEIRHMQERLQSVDANCEETDIAESNEVVARGWSREVKQLDARISGVLDKIKERELYAESKIFFFF